MDDEQLRDYTQHLNAQALDGMLGHQDEIIMLLEATDQLYETLIAHDVPAFVAGPAVSGIVVGRLMARGVTG